MLRLLPTTHRLSSAVRLAAVIATLLPFSAPETRGIGFRIPSQDSLATARGDAFVATADNPSAAYYNPAGIVQIEGTSISGGAYLFHMRTRYRDPDSGETTRNRKQVHPVPHFFASHNQEGSPMAYSLALVAPFGLSNEWPESVPFGEGTVTYISVMPAVAFEVSPTLSIAAGPVLNDGDVEFVQPIPGGSFRFNGVDTTIGYHLGLLWRPDSRHSFGANFRGADKLKLDGTRDIQPAPGPEPATASLPIPEYLVVGYSFRPVPEWNFEANIDWTRWSRLGTVTVQSDTFPIDMPFNWKSSVMYQIGATRYLADGYRVSGGYVFSENSVPDEDFSPLVPDSDRHLLTVGYGRSHDRLSWDIGLQYGLSPTRRVPESEAPANGEYKTFTAAATVTFGYAF